MLWETMPELTSRDMSNGTADVLSALTLDVTETTPMEAKLKQNKGGLANEQPTSEEDSDDSSEDSTEAGSEDPDTEHDNDEPGTWISPAGLNKQRNESVQFNEPRPPSRRIGRFSKARTKKSRYPAVEVAKRSSPNKEIRK